MGTGSIRRVRSSSAATRRRVNATAVRPLSRPSTIARGSCRRRCSCARRKSRTSPWTNRGVASACDGESGAGLRISGERSTMSERRLPQARRARCYEVRCHIPWQGRTALRRGHAAPFVLPPWRAWPGSSARTGHQPQHEVAQPHHAHDRGLAAHPQEVWNCWYPFERVGRR